MFAQVGPLVAEAFSVLLGNRTRSLLTVLGLIIGVAAVIAIEILGHGMAGAVGGVLGSLNDRSFYMFPNQQQGDFSKASFNWTDVQHVEQTFPAIVTAVPGGGSARIVTVGHERARLGVAADSDVSFAALPLDFGRDISSDDVATSAHVAVLSHRAYFKLFPNGGDPTGASLRIGDRRFVVIGVQSRPLGIVPVNFGGDLSIPYTTYVAEYLQDRPIFVARFLVAKSSDLPGTEAAVVAYFKALRGGNAQYQTFDRRSFSSSVDGIFGALTLVVALIGAVSLVVAGIGIMNIMLVSVSERTREIGVRKAIGATRSQILAQFFIEALLLSFVGCGIGLVLGVAIGAAVDRLALVRLSGVVPQLPWFSSIAIAVGFATVVTLIFGTYPAYRAARLDPIEALRYE